MEKKAQKFNPFLFENEFSKAQAKPDDTPPVLTQEDIAQAQAQGYAKGLQEGKEQALEDFNKNLTAYAAELDTALKNTQDLQKKAATHAAEHALKLLEVITEALLGDARKNYPQELLANILRGNSPEDTTPLTIITAPQAKAYIEETLLPKLSKQNHKIKLEESLTPGDCCLVWPNGGLELKHEITLKSIQKILQQGVAQAAEDITQALNETPDTTNTPPTEKEKEAQPNPQEAIPPVEETTP